MIIQNGNENQLQQGDQYIEKFIGDFKTVEKKQISPTQYGYILAEGSATGNTHHITDIKKVNMFEYYNKQVQTNCLLLEILSVPVTLLHQEHGAITFEKPGIYHVNTGFEFDVAEQVARKIQD